MAQSKATMFVDDAAVTARKLEVVGADFDGGVNIGGSCAAGIGINMDQGAVVGTPEQFTLLDQHGDARNAQISQSIGGLPYVDRSTIDWPSSGGTEGTAPDAVIRFGTSDDLGLGLFTSEGNSAMIALATGWLAGV
jgi:hypothetical protein